ncbi:MAG: hypothetical protein OEL76_10695 [Siculibacillus sp.]|nr:hypothetical protein [Siculibacillus sp.]
MTHTLLVSTFYVGLPILALAAVLILWTAIYAPLHYVGRAILRRRLDRAALASLGAVVFALGIGGALAG